ncbi:MAG: type II secretion system major pseudopilin GspG [Aestuariivirgaceae bacterium]|nr:type II secretion system major pseudopilin GspG [Aestuariivirgaceae bacterium]
MRKAGSEDGFTLVELLVVLVILALLAGIVGPKVIGYLGDSRIKTARIQMASYRTALELFHLDIGRFPKTGEGLKALAIKPFGLDGWRGPYLDKPVSADPWGHAYVYASPGSKAEYEILSLGRDGRQGGEGEDADILP